jgi:hypothetical protein
VGSTGKTSAVVFVRLFFAQIFYVGVELGLSYLGENKRLKVSENSALGKTFGQKEEEETADSQELYCPYNIFRAIKRMWEERITYRTSVGELEWKDTIWKT